MIEDRKTLSFSLALAMHGLIAAALYFGLQWQTRPVAVEEIEFWSPPPPEAAPEPEPEPRPEPVKPPPAESPPAAKPDIALEAPKPKPPKPKPVPPPEPPKPEKQPPPKAKEPPPAPEKPKPAEIRSPLADLLARQKAAEASERANANLSQLAQRNQAAEAQSGARNSSGAKDAYLGQLRNKIRRNMTYPDDAAGNPEAMLEITLLPDMTILEVIVVQSSGTPAFDDAVKRALLRTGQYPPLPPELAFSDFRKHKLRYKLRD